uniref:Uncharacterized protein n=1 Tax=Podoviridae sp. ctrTt13 TaxID=2825279 RepID=A0A8S5NTQ3_9CAUD|nr:MAG TPA: Protein of unknown function (DUF2678) [Podoviridae sp. ctrTt13]
MRPGRVLCICTNFYFHIAGLHIISIFAEDFI